MKLKFSKLTAEEKARINANPSFKDYLSKLWKGRPATPESWWFEGKPDNWVRDTAYKIAVSANKTTPFATFFDQNEKKNVEKFGEQGKVPSLRTKEAQSVIEPLYEDRVTNDPDYFQADEKEEREFAQYLFGSQNLLSKRRKGFNAVIDDMNDRDTLSSNSGDSRFTRRKAVTNEEIEDARSGAWRQRAAILLFRHYHGKLRPVWMYPMSRNLIEYQFSQVIQDAMRKSPNEQVRNHLTPWEGYDDVKRTLTRQWRKARQKFGDRARVQGGDTTKMDAETRRAHAKKFFNIVKWLFQKAEWPDLWEAIEQVFTIDLFTGTNSKLVGIHGLASGSGWTQLIETVMILYMMWKHGVQDSMGIGDDFECFGQFTAETMVEWLSELKYPANVTKQSSSTEYLDFLQRVNCYGFMSVESKETLGAYYSLVRAANSIKRPEKYHNDKNWSSDQFCNKFYMVMENCIDDPGFDAFMRWAIKGQKDIVAFAKKPAKELNRIQKVGKTIPGLNPSYNQEKRTKPLSSFYSINWVKQNC